MIMEMEIYLIENIYGDAVLSKNTEQEKIIENSEEQKEIIKIKKKRISYIDPSKVYARANKSKTSSLYVSIYIGVDIFNLLKFDVLQRASIYSEGKNNSIEITQNSKQNDYLFSNGKTSVKLTFTLPQCMFLHPFDTKEVNFDFTKERSLLINLGI